MTRLSTNGHGETLPSVRLSPGQPRPAKKIAGTPGPRKAVERTSWVARWSAIIVALITTAGVITAAVIALQKPDSGGSTGTAALATASIDIAHGSDGQKISITGTVKNWQPAAGYIFGFAKPKDNGPIAGDQTAYWYVGGPALVGPDGRWSVLIKVGATEKRDLSVSAALLPTTDQVPANGEPPVEGEPPDSAPHSENSRRDALLVLLGVNGPKSATAATPPQDVRTSS